MRLTVLGSAASYAGAGEACAGHLVEAGSTKVLLDCGNGVLANYLKIGDVRDISAIFVSHYHPDHYLDLFALVSLLRYDPGGPLEPIELHLPAGLFDRMKQLLSERGQGELDESFVVHDVIAGQSVKVGALTVTPLPVEHTEPTFGMRVEGEGRLLAYTADSRPCDGVEDVVRGADLVLSEATLPDRYSGVAPHMTAREAGALASRAGAKTLVLAHVWPTNDRDAMHREAAEVFAGNVCVAKELDVFDI